MLQSGAKDDTAGTACSRCTKPESELYSALNYTHDAQELVEKKLELAELHEEMLKINHRQAAGRCN